jgi:hypothetical protein
VAGESDDAGVFCILVRPPCSPLKQCAPRCSIARWGLPLCPRLHRRRCLLRPRHRRRRCAHRTGMHTRVLCGGHSDGSRDHTQF